MKITHVSSAVLAVATLAACGPTKLAPIDQATSQQAGLVLGNTVEASAQDLKSKNPGAAADACYTVTGDASDGDGDGIVTDATVTYDNCTSSDSNATAVLNGHISVKDNDTSASTFNFQGDSALILVVTTPGGASATAKRVGGIIGLEPDANHFELKHAVASEVSAQANGESFDATEKYGFDEAYAPDSAWLPGQPLVSGTYSLTGGWDATVADHEAKAGVTTAVPLSIDPSCPSMVVGGEVDAGFQGDNDTRVLKVIWSGCGQRTVFYAEQSGTPAS
jgi:hypothetical protein